MHPGPARRARLAQILVNEGIDAVLLSTPVSMGYLHGYPEAGGERFLTLALSAGGDVALLAPALAETQARRCGIADVRVWRDGEDPLALAATLAHEWNLRTGIVAVDDEMTARLLLQWQAVLPAALFRPAGEALGQVMRSKDAQELDAMRRAGAISDAAFTAVVPHLRAGMTELQVQRLLEDAQRERGGKPTFCIVATGSGSAEPHHHSDGTVLRDGDVLILDFGCEVEGYQSDITRTVCLGTPPPGADEVYAIVLAAHRAGREAVSPGVPAEVVDTAARGVIEAAGYGEAFMHRTGHGIGTRVHEPPYLVAGNDAPLVEGDCFSVEPGIYLPGRFGIRIENIVTVGPKGAVSLNAEPPESLLRCGA